MSDKVVSLHDKRHKEVDELKAEGKKLMIELLDSMKKAIEDGETIGLFIVEIDRDSYPSSSLILPAGMPTPVVIGAIECASFNLKMSELDFDYDE